MLTDNNVGGSLYTRGLCVQGTEESLTMEQHISQSWRKQPSKSYEQKRLHQNCFYFKGLSSRKNKCQQLQKSAFYRLQELKGAYLWSSLLSRAIYRIRKRTDPDSLRVHQCRCHSPEMDPPGCSRRCSRTYNLVKAKGSQIPMWKIRVPAENDQDPFSARNV